MKEPIIIMPLREYDKLKEGREEIVDLLLKEVQEYLQEMYSSEYDMITSNNKWKEWNKNVENSSREEFIDYYVDPAMKYFRQKRKQLEILKDTEQ